MNCDARLTVSAQGEWECFHCILSLSTHVLTVIIVFKEDGV